MEPTFLFLASTFPRKLFAPTGPTQSLPTFDPTSQATSNTTMDPHLIPPTGGTAPANKQLPARKLILPPHSASPGSLFRLPCELRKMIYTHLLPEAKTVMARGSYNFPGRPAKWTFYMVDSIAQPVLTQICKETRTLMLKKGNFIFTTGSEEASDGGLWWNSQKVST